MQRGTKDTILEESLIAWVNINFMKSLPDIIPFFSRSVESSWVCVCVCVSVRTHMWQGYTYIKIYWMVYFKDVQFVILINW